MTIRSKVSGRHLLRLTVVGLFCIGFGLYCLYDGMIGYPAQRERALKFQELEELNQLEDWPRVAAENGWKPFDPGKPKTEAEITVQFYMMAVCGVAGLLVLTKVLRSLGRWVEMDNAGLRSNRGQAVQFDQIRKIDKKKWDNKGIAKVHYQENGRAKVFTLDDFVYDRPTTDDILRKLENRVGIDKIVNGKPEPPPKAKPEPAAPAEAAPQ
jgi:hypothetical protein